MSHGHAAAVPRLSRWHRRVTRAGRVEIDDGHASALAPQASAMAAPDALAPP